MKLEQWRAGILSFESKANVENPFLDVCISAVFTGPSGRKIWREAYWDGGSDYRISFAPTETGVWTYTLTAPADTGLDGTKGELECVSYSGNLAIYKHGFPKVSANGRYLEYADGTPFFWLGDTHWGFVAGEKWGESNYPAMKSMFKGMVDKRVEQDFTVYQTNLRSEVGRTTHYWADGMVGKLPDVEFYQGEVDKRMQYIADAGLVGALGFAWSGSVLGEGALDLQKNLARYIIARYGALPVVWTLAGEVAGYTTANRQAAIDGWREIALLTEKLDGYGTLQTAHYTNDRPFADYYQDETWFDFTLNQAGHGDYPINSALFKEHREKYPGKPFIEGEALYEFVMTMEENGGRICDDGMVRRVAYMSIQLGGCGYTYGAQGIWDTVWEKPEVPNPFNAFNPHGITWYEGVEGEGAKQMGYMRSFYEAAGFEKLRPRGDIYTSAMANVAKDMTGQHNPLVSASDDLATVVAYYNTFVRISPDSELHCLTAKTYSVKWFNPRTGEYSQAEDAVPEDGKWHMPQRPDAKDWLLVLKAK